MVMVDNYIFIYLFLILQKCIHIWSWFKNKTSMKAPVWKEAAKDLGMLHNNAGESQFSLLHWSDWMWKDLQEINTGLRKTGEKETSPRKLLFTEADGAAVSLWKITILKDIAGSSEAIKKSTKEAEKAYLSGELGRRKCTNSSKRKILFKKKNKKQESFHLMWRLHTRK